MRLEFLYDLQGRRVEKKRLRAGQTLARTTTLYDGWRPMLDIDYAGAGGAEMARRYYSWGPDVSGSLDGAAGIGGLLEIVEKKGNAITRSLPLYDGIGNLVGLVDAGSGERVATYEYGPFGEPISVSGPRAASCPLRFQTKRLDEDLGFYDFGKRHYDPKTQCWLSRDPIREAGGVNLYAYCQNDPVGNFDPLGLKWTVADNHLYWTRGQSSQDYGPLYLNNSLTGDQFLAVQGKLRELLCGIGPGCAVAVGENEDILSTTALLTGAWPKEVSGGHIDIMDQVNRLGEARVLADVEPHGAMAFVDNRDLNAILAYSNKVWKNPINAWGRDHPFFTQSASEAMAAAPLAVIGAGPVRSAATTQPRNALGRFMRKSSGQTPPGANAVDNFVAQAQANGYEVVSREMSFNTPFGQRRYDLVLRNTVTGATSGVEIKSSTGAMDRWDAAARQQFAADRWINMNGGATSVGSKGGITIESTYKIQW